MDIEKTALGLIRTMYISGVSVGPSKDIFAQYAAIRSANVCVDLLVENLSEGVDKENWLKVKKYIKELQV